MTEFEVFLVDQYLLKFEYYSSASVEANYFH